MCFLYLLTRTTSTHMDYLPRVTQPMVAEHEDILPVLAEGPEPDIWPMLAERPEPDPSGLTTRGPLGAELFSGPTVFGTASGRHFSCLRAAARGVQQAAGECVECCSTHWQWISAYYMAVDEFFTLLVHSKALELYHFSCHMVSFSKPHASLE